MHLRIILAATAGLLSACSQATETPPDLAKVCQVRKCTCTETGAGIFRAPDTADILWRENGDAYCPVGYELRLVPPPPPGQGGIRLN